MNTIGVRRNNWCFQHRSIALMLLIGCCLSWSPLTAFAQQLTVTDVTGMLSVDGQEASEGIALLEEMVLETLADGTAIVELSDGSRFEIGEQTRLLVVKTAQTDAVTKILRLKLLQGWVRAKLADDTQTTGLIFDVETSNAVIGAKMVKSDVEVGYAEAQQETVGIAHGIELRAENLLSGEKRDIPKGSTVLILAENMEVIEGTERSQSSDNAGSGILDKFTDTKALLVVGGLLGATAVTAALIDQNEEISEADLVGDFERTDTADGGDMIHERFSISEGRVSKLEGYYQATRSGPNCQYAYIRDLTGSVNVNTAFLTLAALTYTQTCVSETTSVSLSTNTWTCTLHNEKSVLRCKKPDGTQADYQRQ